jgi:DnaJ like chaperone protein
MAFFFMFFLILGVMAVRVATNVRNDREWNEGLFEANQTEDGIPHDPLLEAYISLGALMIRKDTSSYSEKILYLNSYFSKNFPRSHYQFGRSLTESIKNPVRTQTISKWLRRKLPKREQRLQVMYFLASISTIDGSMNKREIELLKEMNLLLELSPKDFDSIIAMYTQKRERTQSTGSSKPRISEIQIACRIIGVSEHASMDEIKKAYRNLVKLHHPDCFATESNAQQEIAEERFLEIQKAYEILEKR